MVSWLMYHDVYRIVKSLPIPSSTFLLLGQITTYNLTIKCCLNIIKHDQNTYINICCFCVLCNCNVLPYCMWLYVLPLCCIFTWTALILTFSACTSCTVSVFATTVFNRSFILPALSSCIFSLGFLLLYCGILYFLGCLLSSGQGLLLEISHAG